jgi:hypothetical protein
MGLMALDDLWSCAVRQGKLTALKETASGKSARSVFAFAIWERFRVSFAITVNFRKRTG